MVDEKVLDAVPEKLRKTVKKHLAEEAEAAALFDIDEFIIGAEKVREVYVREINRRVQYKKLTVAEGRELFKIADKDERSAQHLFLLLHKANPNITREKIDKLNDDEAAAILSAILREHIFLRTPTA